MTDQDLEQLVVVVVEPAGVFPPELVRLVHQGPLQAARLDLCAVLVQRAAAAGSRQVSRGQGRCSETPQVSQPSVEQVAAPVSD